MHRSLGVSVSRIKSLVYDEWDAAMANAMLSRGNDYARSYYLATLPPGTAVPNEQADEAKLRAHSRNKYVRLRWAEAETRAEQQAMGGRAGAGCAGAGRSHGGGGGEADRRPGIWPT